MRGKKFISLTLSTMLCLQLLPTASFAAAPATDTGNAGLIAEGDYAIAGNGVRVTYDADGQTITLYRTEGSGLIQMSKPSPLGGPVVGGQEVQDFSHISCDVEQSTSGVMGSGQRMTITSQSMSTGLIRTYVLETSDIEEGVVYTATSYEAGASDVEVSWFIGSVYELYGAEDRIWSYNGGGEGPMHYYDTLQKIDLTDSGKFSRENKQDDTAASIPVSDIYIADGGITVGDASATRREVHTPVQETSDSAQVSIGWPGKVIAAGSVIEIGESFAVVHPGDYYNGLRGYKNAMDHLGVIMPAPGDIPDSSYDLRWESWGWGFNWTIDLIIGKLDELQAAGVKQITLDDGWYTNAGDWALNPEKFPNGASDALRLTDAIHEHGMTALLWWRPCDGGIDSILYQQHPEYFVMDADGRPARLPTPGGGTNPSLGYALCPMADGAIASQVDFVNRAMNDWGFDGFKGDYVWSMPECYNPAHNHASPEESTEKQSEIYRVSYEAMVANDPNVFNLLCNCGTPQDYYSLPYMTQIATADPTSVDQTRRRVKAYKALMGDYFPVTADHNNIWYPSAVGTGSVLIEKRDLTGLEEGEHTIRLVQNAWNINLDYISYLPEQDQPTPPETTVTVDAMDAQLVYTGVWNDDYHDVFQEGTARYAISAGASVEFEFTGSEIRWYGQNDSNFGVASVYIDNEFVQQVNVNGAAAVGKLLFQKTDLPAGSHTIRIVCDTPVIDLDYLTYTTKA